MFPRTKVSAVLIGAITIALALVALSRLGPLSMGPDVIRMSAVAGADDARPVIPTLAPSSETGRAMSRPQAGVLARSTTSGASTNIKPADVFAAFRHDEHVVNGTEYFKGASFVGADACASCHAREVAEWRQTWHAKMEQWPSAETVVGNFDNQIITYADIPVVAADGVKSQVTFRVKTHTKDGAYFFTVLDADNAANNQTFRIAKTLGGKWDQGYEIKIGDNYFPAILRYSVKQDSWLVKTFNPEHWVVPDGTPDGRPRRAEELPKDRVAEAKCQGCHTTGFEYSEDKQAGLWKASGNGELGVACEKCHGPASLHVAAAQRAERQGVALVAKDSKIVNPVRHLDYNQQTQVCAQCHGRSGHKTQPALAFPTGFIAGDTNIQDHLRFWSYQGTSNPNEIKYFYSNDWAKRNRQQWQDFTKSTHFNKAGMSCLSCHTFHGKWEDMHLREKPMQLCQGCHTSEGRTLRPQSEMFEGSKMETAGVRCNDCHMARIGYRSHLTQKSSATADYPLDGSSHTFMVPTPAMKKQFGVRTACEVCHVQGRAMPDHIATWVSQRPMTDDALQKRMNESQEGTRRRIAEVHAALRTLKAVPPELQLDIATVKANIAFVQADGSLGFHNIDKTNKLLDEAMRLVSNAAQATFGATATATATRSRPSDVTRAAILPATLTVATPASQSVAMRRALRLARRAALLRASGQYDRAVVDYTEALAIDPMLTKALSGRACALFKLGRIDEALADAQTALAQQPDNAAVLDTRGHILEALGRRDEAIADYRRALAKTPNKKPSKDALKRLETAALSVR